MNKRMKRKMTKQLEMAAAPAQRIENEIKGTATHVMAEIKTEVIARANKLEKKIEKQLEKIPMVGEAAAQKLAEISEKLQEKTQVTG